MKVEEFFRHAAVMVPKTVDITDENRKYFVSGMEDLSKDVYLLLCDGMSRFVNRYERQYRVNPLQDGFKTKEELIHFAQFVVEEFQVLVQECQEALDRGIMSPDDIKIGITGVYRSVLPIHMKLQKIADM